MHLIRLLLSGIARLKEGIHRERLLEIRGGCNFILSLTFQSIHLPKRPDYDKVNAFLIEARQSTVRSM